MPSSNDITGDSLHSRVTTDSYRSNYDAIFGKKQKSQSVQPDTKPDDDSTSGPDEDVVGSSGPSI